MTAVGGDGTGPKDLDAALVRLWNERRSTPVGAGFLVTEELLVTCAHVVTAALGTAAAEQPPPEARVRVDLPLAGTRSAQVWAVVERWSAERDMALLRLTAPAPGARPVRLVHAPDVWGHPMRCFGFPAGRESGVWHAGTLRARQSDGWIQAELASPSGYPVSAGFSGGPVWDERLVGVVGMVVVAESRHPPASYLIPTDGLFADWPDLESLALPESPFRSLSAFSEADAGLFFGRARESAEVADRVRSRSLVTLVGPSGCGKSSLAMAGVAPRLRGDGYEVAVFRPASSGGPRYALAGALLPLLTPESGELDRLGRVPELAAELVRQGLHPVVERILQRTGARRLLLVADQFEELLAVRPEERRELARLLFEDGALPESVRLLVTLRADFLEPALADTSLGPVLSREVYALHAMDRDGLREVINGPLTAVPAVRYEADLADRLLTDAGQAPGALPLLGLTLDLLWHEQSGGRLTIDSYNRLGRVAGALGQHAEAVWREYVPEKAQADARRLFTRLVRIPAGSGSGAALRRMAARAELGAGEWEVARRLAATRLLVTGRAGEGGETVELAHEALISGWPRLAAWVAEDHEFLAWRETLRQDCRRWSAAGRPTELLPGTLALTQAQRWLPERAAELSADERDFLDQGRRRRRSTLRRRRGLQSGIGLAVVLTLLLGSLFVYQREVSAERQAAADSRALAGVSADEKSQNPALAIKLALAAYRAAPTEEAENALLRYYAEYGSDTRVLSGTLGRAAGMQASRDGKVILVRSFGGRLTLFLNGVQGKVRSRRLTGPVQALHGLVADDGSRVGYVGMDGSVVWYKVRPDRSSLVGPHHWLRAETLEMSDMANVEMDYWARMSPDGRAVTALTEKSVVRWDLDRGRITGRIAVLEERDGFFERQLWSGTDGTVLLQIGTTHSENLLRDVLAVDLETGDTRVVVGGVEEAAVSGQGRSVVACREEKTDGTLGTRAVYREWRISGEAQPGRYVQQEEFCALTTAAPNGGRFVYRHNGAAVLADLREGSRVAEAQVPPGSWKFQLARLVTGGDGPVLIQYNHSGVFCVRLVRVADANRLALTVDGRAVISVLRGGARIQARPLEDTEPMIAQARRSEPHWDAGLQDRLRLSPDGSLLADREGRSKVVIRTVPGLRKVSELGTAVPKSSGTWDKPYLNYFFNGDGELVTVADTTIQRWDIRSGRLIDQDDLRDFVPLPEGVEPPDAVTVAGHPKPHRVVLAVDGDPRQRVVDLAADRQTAALKTHRDTLALSFSPSGRYFALMRRGRNVELWRRDPLAKEMGPLPSPDDAYGGIGFVSRFLDGGERYLLGYDNRLRIYQPGRRAHRKSFDFGPWGTSATTQTPRYLFRDVSRNGRTLLYERDDGLYRFTQTLDLRPEVWVEALCETIGRQDFTSDQRRSQPVRIPPGPVCPG